MLNASMMLHLYHIINDEKLHEIWFECLKLNNFSNSHMKQHIYVVQIGFVKIRFYVFWGVQTTNNCKHAKSDNLTKRVCLSNSRGSGHNVFENWAAWGRVSDTLQPAPAFVYVYVCVCQAGRCVETHVSNTCPLASVLISVLWWSTSRLQNFSMN